MSSSRFDSSVQTAETSSTPTIDSTPPHEAPILGMTSRPYVDRPTMYGGTLDVEGGAGFWVEYPNGLMDLTRSAPLSEQEESQHANGAQGMWRIPIMDERMHVEIEVEGTPKRKIRVSSDKAALVVIDMQNFFLHPDIRQHPKGLDCVQPLMNVIPVMREMGMKILWVNWGLTEHELKTIPPALVRAFRKHGGGGLGSQMSGDFGRLLMRDQLNSALYGPLQTEYEAGREKGTDFWIHKNRISGLWGYQTALDLFLRENGIKTLFFAGVNSDQCVLGTLADAYFRGYDCIIVRDANATTSPDGGFENVIYNAGNTYGFVTDTRKIIAAAK